jgi:hypothetical protein
MCIFPFFSHSDFDRILQLPEDESAQDLNSGQSSPAPGWFLSSRSSNHAVEVDEFGITKTVLLNNSAARDRVSSVSKAQVKFVMELHVESSLCRRRPPTRVPGASRLAVEGGVESDLRILSLTRSRILDQDLDCTRAHRRSSGFVMVSTPT